MILRGVLHHHSNYSLCCFGGLSPKQVYKRVSKSRYLLDFKNVFSDSGVKLDFFALTDHDLHLTDEKYKKYSELCDEYNSKDLITLHGLERTPTDGMITLMSNKDQVKNSYLMKPLFKYYESRARNGVENHLHNPSECHRVLLFKDAPSELISVKKRAYHSFNDMIDAVRRAGGMIIPHHTVGGPTPPAVFDYEPVELERLIEIYCGHGSSEGLSPNIQSYNYHQSGSVIKYLQSHFAGFTAGTDSHGVNWPFLSKLSNYYPEVMTMVLRKAYGDGGRVNQNKGLTFVYAGERSRDALWDGLWNRHTYASTGYPHLVMKFSVNDVFMGGEARSDGSARVRASVKAGVPVQSLDLILNGEIIQSTRADSLNEVLEIIESSVIYPRVTLTNGAVGWASPVKIEYKK